MVGLQLNVELEERQIKIKIETEGLEQGGLWKPLHKRKELKEIGLKVDERWFSREDKKRIINFWFLLEEVGFKDSQETYICVDSNG